MKFNSLNSVLFSSKGKRSLYLHSASCIASILHPAVTWHSSVEHQDVPAHTYCQSPALEPLASFVLVIVQRKLDHIQRLLIKRFQHSPMSYPKAS